MQVGADGVRLFFRTDSNMQTTAPSVPRLSAVGDPRAVEDP